MDKYATQVVRTLREYSERMWLNALGKRAELEAKAFVDTLCSELCRVFKRDVEKLAPVHMYYFLVLAKP